MNTKLLVEAIGLNSDKSRLFLNRELDEFIKAKNREDKVEEFHDIYFTLLNFAFAHSELHLEVDKSIYEKKIADRLIDYGTISRKEPIFHNNFIKKIKIGLVHIAFGSFKQPWNKSDPVKNGTEAEIVSLTNNDVFKRGKKTNHLIITYDKVSNLEYSFLSRGRNRNEGNVILCRIPDFAYHYSKKNNKLLIARDILAYQFRAAISNIFIKNNAIFHFHSWESGLVISSNEVKVFIGKRRKIFSPYLTISRFRKEFRHLKNNDNTCDKNELLTAAKLESELLTYCNSVVVESHRDKDFYSRITTNKILLISYSRYGKISIKPQKSKKERLHFVAGGRPVHEKGFIELIKAVPEVIKFAHALNLEFKLNIFCKEYDRATGKEKKLHYIKELHRIIDKMEIKKYVYIKNKISIDNLKSEISKSSGLIVPSLYDSYCLMPNYAIDVNAISFVSTYTGISENIMSKQYLFNPLKKDSLLLSIKKWLNTEQPFILNNINKSYKDLYL